MLHVAQPNCDGTFLQMTSETQRDFIDRVIKLGKFYRDEAERLSRLCIQFAPVCEGCQLDSAGQNAHMGENGCLRLEDPSTINQDVNVLFEDHKDDFYTTLPQSPLVFSPLFEEEEDALISPLSLERCITNNDLTRTISP